MFRLSLLHRVDSTQRTPRIPRSFYLDFGVDVAGVEEVQDERVDRVGLKGLVKCEFLNVCVVLHSPEVSAFRIKLLSE